MNVRGSGLMLGLEMIDANDLPATAASLAVIKLMLRRGFILLPEGEHGNVISFTPPLTITKPQLQTMLKALRQTLEEVLDR